MSKQGERSRGHPLIRLPIVGSPIGQGSRGVCCPMFSVLPGSGEKAFEGPERLMVGSGEFQFINCTASCKDPKRLVLETALNKILLEDQTQWKLFKVYNMSKDEELLCSSTCGDKQETKVFHIAVFCECRPRALLPEAGACVCKPPQSCSVTGPGRSPVAPTSLGSWIQATGSESAHTHAWPNLVTPTPGLLEPCQRPGF